MNCRPLSLTYAAALVDPSLLGALPAFRDASTWARWVTFLKAVEGVPLDAGELETFSHHTGRSTYDPPAGGWREVLAVVGRQSGKSRIAGAIQAVEAIRATATPTVGDLYVVTIAQDARAALRAVHAYAVEPFDAVPMFARLVVGRTVDTVSLRGGVRVSTYPCRPAAVRGIRAQVAVLDEAAFFLNSEARPTDVEMIRAIRPALLTTHGRVIILSSPYGQSGVVYDLFKRHWGRADSDVLVWRASSPEMNPTLDPADLERLRDADPEAYESEVGGHFRSGLSTLFDADALDACVDVGVRERPKVPGTLYHAGLDLSGGRRDRAALVVVHVHEGRVLLDAVRVWAAPHDPARVIVEAVETLRAYGLREAHADAYAAEFAVGLFRERGITLRPAGKDRSALFLTLLPLVNSQQVVLLDHRLLLAELHGLERRRGPSGRDRVDHRVAGHDDVAVAAAAAISRAVERLRPSQVMVMSIDTGEVVPLAEHNKRLRAAELGLVPLYRGD